MGNKIFVTYKYSDSNVEQLKDSFITSTSRKYVDKIEDVISQEDHIYKGESDGEDLSKFKDETIESKIKDKIFDSSLTIVVISPGMKEPFRSEEDQWIPWEISYSLRSTARGGRVKKPNAFIAVVLPDKSGSYEYYIVDNHCASCNSRLLKTRDLFGIISENMFNKKNPEYVFCSNHSGGGSAQKAGCSYIASVKWEDFISSPQNFIDDAYARREKIDDYNIRKLV